MNIDKEILRRCGYNVILPSPNLSSSTAKQKYSFSTAERFPSTNLKSGSRNLKGKEQKEETEEEKKL